MATHYTIRFATNPKDFVTYGTQRLRDDFLMPELFSPGHINLVYTHYDRFIVGGVMPATKPVGLESIKPLKADHFLDRREIGIINVGGKGVVKADGRDYELEYKEALYIGMGVEEVSFSNAGDNQALFYLNSAPAHTPYPLKKVAQADSEIVELGSLETSNQRVIRKLIVNSIVDTNQLQMGMTELAAGSVWNTMPAHVHDRRMEAYLYFELPEDQAVCHFLGEPDNTRHIWLHNNQAVLSPPWSVHSGSGTSNYTFIWGMAGENLDYGDMEMCSITELR
ncbi:MAG: 5-dehydro-4-deoxy-D-glucuronate isomerase [Balneolales bacterium]